MMNPTVHYRANIETIIDEVIKNYKHQCFLHLSGRLKRSAYVEVQVAIISGVMQTMIQYLEKVGANTVELKDIFNQVSELVSFHFKTA